MDHVADGVNKSADPSHSLERDAGRRTYELICGLPTELIVKIFKQFQRNAPLSVWHRIAHVCQEWRTIALSEPTLWTEPPTWIHEYTMVMLNRSKDSPLEVFIEVGTDEATIDAIAGHAGRIQSLFVWHDEQHIDSILSRIRNSQPNILQSLEVRQYPFHDEPVIHFTAGMITSLPHLKRLKLDRLHIGWNMLPLPNLVLLSISEPKSTPCISWDQFAAALSAMPVLQDVNIPTNCVKLTPTPSVGMSISMPQLRSLALSGGHWTLTELRYFLSHTAFPGLQHAFITCTFGDGDDFISTYNAVFSLLEKGQFPPLNYLCADVDSITLRSTSRDSLFTFRQNTRKSTRVVDGYQLSRHFMSLLKKATRGADITHMTWMMYWKEQPLDLLVQMFGWLPNLNSIDALYNSGPLFRALASRPSTPGEEIPFSTLTHLTLSENIFANQPTYIQELRDFLIMRREHGAAIKYLKLYWSVEETDLNLLKEIVDEVHIAQRRGCCC